MLGIECEAVRVPGKRRAAELYSQPLPLQLTDETHLPESMSSEQTVIFVMSRNTALSYMVCVHFHVAGSVSSRSEFPRSSMAGSSCMRGLVRRCQIPLAVGMPSVMYENACLPTAHRKHCRPCLSGPSSPFLPHSGASLCTPSHLRASPISYLSTPPFCLSHFGVPWLPHSRSSPLSDCPWLSRPSLGTGLGWQQLGCETRLEQQPP